MAILKKNELKNMSKKSIDDKMIELKKELMKFNSQRAVKTTLENPGKVKEIRRSIAKLLTIQNQLEKKKELEEVKKKV